MGCFVEAFVFRAKQVMWHQDGHPRLRCAPAVGPRLPANQLPPSSGSASLAGSRVAPTVDRGPTADDWLRTVIGDRSSSYEP
jgi:hypothetical protein